VLSFGECKSSSSSDIRSNKRTDKVSSCRDADDDHGHTNTHQTIEADQITTIADHSDEDVIEDLVFLAPLLNPPDKPHEVGSEVLEQHHHHYHQHLLNGHTSDPDDWSDFVNHGVADEVGDNGAAMLRGMQIDSFASDEDLASSTTCQSDTGGSCVWFSCGAWRGVTTCTAGKCMCRPGYCADMAGICRGCQNVSVEIHDVPLQNDKNGNYVALPSYTFQNRPVWKQLHGNNWMWFCELHSCWVLSDLGPNVMRCDAGMVSPASSLTRTPFDLRGSWKLWDGRNWIDGDAKRFLRSQCHDNRMNTFKTQSNFAWVSGGRATDTSDLPHYS